MDELTRLLLDARDGDRLAFTTAIRSTQGEVLRMAAHLVGSSEAEDVAQDTYLRAYRALPTFRGDASARTWLLVIARRACIDAVRTSMRRRRVSARAAIVVLDEAAPSAEGATTIVADAWLHLLSADRREAFVLTQLLGCSYAETATIQGVSIGTVRSRVARAREELLALVRGEAAG